LNLILWTTLALVGLDKSAGRLNEYVAKPDPTYQWEVRATEKQQGIEITQIKMVSQTWQGITWKHFVYIMKPEKITVPGHAMLFITGGGWNESFDKPAADNTNIDDLPEEGLALARQAGMPVVAISHVPFQPMFNGLVEDEIISMTFVKYLETRDSSWPLLFPMVKATIRAMDTSQEYMKKTWNIDVDGFTVLGASKRGWTTWLTAATGDPRVKAIMPIVIDTLNMPEQMKHQLESYGEFSEQIKDYTEKGIQMKMESEIGKELNAMVDPYSYRKLLTLPKLIVNGTNDPYWTLDALNLYWGDLEGPKYIFYAPNGGHGLNPEGIVRLSTTAINFAKMAAGQQTLPKLDWKIEEGDKGLSLNLKSDLLPAVTRVWTASAPTRDFRKSKWSHVHMETKDDGFEFVLPRPESGFAAAYAEAKYFIDGKPAYFCTNVKIIPARAPGK
jgi:PhoPQ-activated pathogenicity-related protein